jgi:hypothetical protein
MALYAVLGHANDYYFNSFHNHNHKIMIICSQKLESAPKIASPLDRSIYANSTPLKVLLLKSYLKMPMYYLPFVPFVI